MCGKQLHGEKKLSKQGYMNIKEKSKYPLIMLKGKPLHLSIYTLNSKPHRCCNKLKYNIPKKKRRKRGEPLRLSQSYHTYFFLGQICWRIPPTHPYLIPPPKGYRKQPEGEGKEKISISYHHQKGTDNKQKGKKKISKCYQWD